MVSLSCFKYVPSIRVGDGAEIQYMSSKSFVSVDWKKLASSYDSTFGTKTSEGVINQPTIKGAGNWIVDFVTANFQRKSRECRDGERR